MFKLSVAPMLKVLLRDATDCRGDKVPNEPSPDDWEVELGGLETPVFNWSFSAFRFSTVI